MLQWTISHSIGVMYVSTPASTVHHCKVNSAWSRPCPCPPLGRAIAIWDKKAISNYRLHISQSICSQTCDIDRLFHSVGPSWDSVSPYILLYMELIATCISNWSTLCLCISRPYRCRAIRSHSVDRTGGYCFVYIAVCTWILINTVVVVPVSCIQLNLYGACGCSVPVGARPSTHSELIT